MKSSPTTPTAINTCSTTATPFSIASESLIRAPTLRRRRVDETGCGVIATRRVDPPPMPSTLVHLTILGVPCLCRPVRDRGPRQSVPARLRVAPLSGRRRRGVTAHPARTTSYPSAASRSETAWFITRPSSTRIRRPALVMLDGGSVQISRRAGRYYRFHRPNMRPNRSAIDLAGLMSIRVDPSGSGRFAACSAESVVQT
jgi:hypothetical protein